MNSKPIAELSTLRSLPRRAYGRVSARATGVFDPSHDFAVSVTPTRTVLIASSPRSGSSLLSEALSATGRVGAPFEYFNGSTLAEAVDRLGIARFTPAERVRRQARRVALRADWWPSTRIDPDSLGGYLTYLFAHRTSPNGVFAMKVHWSQFAEVRERGLRLESLPQPISWVHITRRDLIAQAVSFARADLTGQWNTRLVPDRYRVRALEYDDAIVERCHRELAVAAAQWPLFFERAGITPIPVVYEDLDADYELVVRRTLDALGLDVDEIAEPGLRRQRDATSTDWIRRFSANHPDLVSN